MTVRYLHLPAGSEPPVIGQDGPFRAVVVIEQTVEQGWRDRMGGWLVRSGCLFAMTWGQEAEVWHDSVDWALMKLHDFNAIPDDKHVMTSWHDDEPLVEVFWFSDHCAWHATVDLVDTWIIDIHADNREALMLADYAAARDAEPYQ